MLSTTNINYDPSFKEDIFQLWLAKGRPGGQVLQKLIKNSDNFDPIPAINTLQKWVTEVYKPRAALLDEEIKRQLDEQVVKEKVAMMKRHAELGGKMQDMALQFLEENEDELTGSSAVRLLVEGVRIERQSRGIPEAIENIVEASDEKLMEELHKIMDKAPVEIEAGSED